MIDLGLCRVETVQFCSRRPFLWLYLNFYPLFDIGESNVLSNVVSQRDQPELSPRIPIGFQQEAFEAVVGLDGPEDGFCLNGPVATVVQPTFAGEKLLDLASVGVVPVVDLYGTLVGIRLVALSTHRAASEVLRAVYAHG